MMTTHERSYLQAKMTTITARPRPPRRDVAGLDARLAVLEQDAPLSRRDVRRILRRRLDLLASNRPQSWTAQWAQEFDAVLYAVKREEAIDGR